MRTLIISLVLLIASTAQAETLSWNANSEPDLAGYKVYQRTGPTYDLPLVTLGKVTQFVLPVLAPGEYFWAITAFDLTNHESAKSLEVTKIILPPPPPPPTIEQRLATVEAELGDQKLVILDFSVRSLESAERIKTLESTVATMGDRITKLEAANLAICRALGGC